MTSSVYSIPREPLPNDEDLCPDGDIHPADDCWRHMCPNYVSELEALAPWGTSGRGLKGWAK